MRLQAVSYSPLPAAVSARSRCISLILHSNNASWPDIKPPAASELSTTRTPGHSFPAVYFLDSLVCAHGQVEIPRVNLSIPPYINEYIGGDPRAVSVKYFESIHVWMPLISKKRFYDYLMNPLSQLSQPRADLTVLIFCMKLINWSPVKQTQDKAKTPAYLAAKRILLAAELDGMLTLQILQASILVLIYEVGHAIFPAAYMSVGTCTKYGLALGIDRQKEISYTASILDILEEEERRRAWWATVVFDRFEPPLNFIDSKISSRNRKHNHLSRLWPICSVFSCRQ